MTSHTGKNLRLLALDEDGSVFGLLAVQGLDLDPDSRTLSAGFVNARAHLRTAGITDPATQDCTAGLRAAVVAASDAGLPLMIPAGTYLAKELLLDAPIHVQGLPGATLKSPVLAAGDGSPIVRVTSDDVTIEGLVFNGQRASQPADGFSDAFSNAGAGGTGRAYRAGIVVYDTANTTAAYDNIRIEDCEFTELYGAGVAAMNVSHLHFAFNYIHDSNFEACFDYDNLGVAKEGNRIIGNTVSDLDSGSLTVSPDAFVLRWCKDFVFTDNTVIRTQRDMVKCELCAHGVISDNTADTNAIDDYPAIQFVSTTRSIVVSNNIIRNFGAGVLLGAIANSDFKDIAIVGNLIDTTTGSSAGDGILAGGAFTGLSGLTICDNRMVAIKRVGINVQGGWSDVFIDGNNVATAGATGAVAIGITLHGGNWSRCCITNNLANASGSTQGAILLARNAAETIADLTIIGNTGIVGGVVPCIAVVAGSVTSGMAANNRGDGFGTFSGMMVSEDNSFAVSAGTGGAYRVVTTDATQMTYADRVVGINIAGATRTITGPALNTAGSGREFVIKDVRGDAAANNITWTPAFGTVDGAASKVISTNYGLLRVFTDNANWFTR